MTELESVNIEVPTEINLNFDNSGRMEDYPFAFSNPNGAKLKLNSLNVIGNNGYTLVPWDSKQNEKQLSLKYGDHVLSMGLNNFDNEIAESESHYSVDITGKSKIFKQKVDRISAFTFNASYSFVKEDFNITFDTDGGIAVTPIICKNGDVITLPDANSTTKEGYNLSKWEVVKCGTGHISQNFIGKTYDPSHQFNTPITGGDIIFKAIWEKKTYELVDGPTFNKILSETVEANNGATNCGEKIRNIYFTDSSMPSNVGGMYNYQIDGLDADNDGGIVSWVNYTSQSSVDVYISTQKAGQKVIANKNCNIMFYNLKYIYQIKFDNFDTSNVTSMAIMFDRTGNSMPVLDLSNLDVSNVSNMNNMFINIGANKILLPKNIQANVDMIDITSQTWYDETDNYKEYPAGNIPVGNAESHTLVREKPKSFILEPKVAEHIRNTIKNNNIVGFAVVMIEFSNEVDYWGDEFYENSGEFLIDVSENKDGSIVAHGSQTATSTFTVTISTRGLNDKIIAPENCENLFYIPVSEFLMYGLGYSGLDILDTSKTKNMASMFYNFDIYGKVSLNTSNVTNMSSMFMYNDSEKIDISSFNTSNVKDMSGMFSMCKSKTILVGDGWNINNVVTSNLMFKDCTSIVGQSGVTYDPNKTDSTMANWETGYLTHIDYAPPVKLKDDNMIANAFNFKITDSKYEEEDSEKSIKENESQINIQDQHSKDESLNNIKEDKANNIDSNVNAKECQYSNIEPSSEKQKEQSELKQKE